MTSTVRVSIAFILVTSLCGCYDGTGNMSDAAPTTSGTTTSGTTTSGTTTSGTSSTKNVDISWLPADTNVDGSTLNNLAGYHIHYGTDSTALTSEIDVPTAGVTDYVVENLKAATYYFAISSYNSQGVESGYS